jgi:HK97 gp10 family phage protein
MRVAVNITGVPQVTRALESLPDAVRADALGNLLFEAAKPVADAARERVRVRSGELKDSIKIGLRSKDAKVRRGAGIFVGSTSWRAHFEEFGTFRQAARSFLRYAYDAQAANARRIIEQGLLDAISKAARRASRRS